MKYKLIKEYPGSHKFGTIVEEKCKTSNFYMISNSSVAILRSHIEDNPDYWEKVNENLWWVVFTKEEALFKTYTPYSIECYAYHAEDSRQYFQTKEEAEKFILYNKPCLSLRDVLKFKRDFSIEVDIEKIESTVKSKL